MTSRLPHRLQPWIAFAQKSGERHGVDPLLVLAVLDRESLGGLALRPQGPAGYGDGMHGRGLCQVDDRSHPEFCDEKLPDGSPAWADPARNIDMGTAILAQNLALFGGDEFLAVAAYNCGVHGVRKALLSVSEPSTDAIRYAAVDGVTTGHKYASDVLARRDRFRIMMQIPDDDEVTK